MLDCGMWVMLFNGVRNNWKLVRCNKNKDLFLNMVLNGG